MILEPKVLDALVLMYSTFWGGGGVMSNGGE